MRAIITKYHPASNLRAPYITATSIKAKIRLSIDDDLTNDEMYRKAAERLCEEMNWCEVDLIQGSLGNEGEVFVMVRKEPVITNGTIHFLESLHGAIESHHACNSCNSDNIWDKNRALLSIITYLKSKGDYNGKES